jgi:hypothetical protein
MIRRQAAFLGKAVRQAEHSRNPPDMPRKPANFSNAAHKCPDETLLPHAERLELSMQSRALHADEFGGAGDIS